ncbi:MAG: Ig-like domain-containing protein [Bacteroidales bacterium]|nr:Ig-like domain-containing protein [Candidatus Sodaliphilus limicaballi]
MGHKTGLFSSTSDFMTASNLVEVYSGSPSLGAVSGWETINLITPFDYNGTDNLVVVVCKKHSSYADYPTYYYTSTSTNNFCLIRCSDDNGEYGNISNTSYSYSSTNERPNIKITLPASTATITATTTDGTNLSASCKVTVMMRAKGVSLNKTTLPLNEGQSETLVATVTPGNTTNKRVTWKSSNTAVATVDENGKVTGVDSGTTIITATTADGTCLSASCDVTVMSKKLYTDSVYDFFGGEDVVVAVKMKNTMDVTGFQTDVDIPYDFSFAKDSDGYPEFYLSDRASRNHSIGTTSMENKKVRVLSYSSTNKTYSGNDGDMFYFKVNTQWDTPIQTYTTRLTNTEFTTPDGTRLDIDNSEIKFRCYYIPGDANHDKKVSISDIIAEARHILLQNPEHFHYKSANVNVDEKISVSDIALTANIILGRLNPDIKYNLPRVMGGDVLSADVVERRGDGSRTIAIALNNATDYTAFQADLGLPAGMEITDARLSDRAGRSHSVAMNWIDGNTVRVLSYASDNAVFAGNSGDLLLIDVKGHGNIEMTNALFAEPNGCEHEFDNMTISTELSGINDITVGNAPVNVYNTAGQLIRTNVNPETATQGLPAGFYLVGGKKVVVR